MTAAAEPAQTPAPDEAAAAIAQGLAHLAELAQIGMSFARALGRVAQAAVEQADGGAPEPTPELADAALAFSRVARAVRMTVGLQAKIVRDRQARADRIAADKAARDEEEAVILQERRAKATLRKAMTRFIVQTAIEAEERDEDEVDDLFAGLDARLAEYGDDPLDFEEVHVKSTAWAIAKALGVDPGPDWWEEGWQFQSPPPRLQRGGGEDRAPSEQRSCLFVWGRGPGAGPGGRAGEGGGVTPPRGPRARAGSGRRWSR
jgi:hypothetical protein